MNIPFVDLKTQYASLKGEIVPALEAIMESSQFVLGKPVEEFERQFAEVHDMKHCVGVGSGTDALHIVLWALGIGPGDEVVSVAHTFIATAEAVSLTGATPVFVDVDPVTYTMDPAKLERAITHKTKLIIPVHLYGQPAEMDAILRVASRHGVPVLEDACQAHLAAYDGKPVGHFGVATAFSFYPGKNLGAYGEAGAVTTNDDALAARLRILRDHGQARKYHHVRWGHNYRLDAMQAVILSVKMKHLRDWTDARRSHAEAYTEKLRGVGDIATPAVHPKATHVYHLYVLRTRHRDALQAHLTSRGIGTGLHYPIPLHLQEAYADLGHAKGSFPVSEQVASEGLSLPMFPELTQEQITYICDAIREFFD